MQRLKAFGGALKPLHEYQFNFVATVFATHHNQSVRARDQCTSDDIACVSVYLEAAIGIEPMNKGFADLCLTTWLRRHIRKNKG